MAQASTTTAIISFGNLVKVVVRMAKGRQGWEKAETETLGSRSSHACMRGGLGKSANRAMSRTPPDSAFRGIRGWLDRLARRFDSSFEREFRELNVRFLGAHDCAARVPLDHVRLRRPATSPGFIQRILRSFIGARATEYWHHRTDAIA